MAQVSAWRARLISTIVVAGVLTACASLAGIEEPNEDVSNNSSTSKKDASTKTPPPTTSQTSVPIETPPNNPVPPATTTQPPPPPPPPTPPPNPPPVDPCTASGKQPLGGNCTQAADCCSNACNAQGECVGDCRAKGQFGLCNPITSEECCIGAQCQNGTKCN